MKELFNLNSPWVQRFAMLTNLVCLNILWLVCCIPVFTAGAAKWNSNDGYKISADPTKDTQFVERIYEELVGVKLELPSIEEIKDIFFTQGKYYQPWGLHINHENSLTRYMYTLNDRDKVAPEYQYVWDMLVEGFYGGVWVYSNDYNNEERIIDNKRHYMTDGLFKGKARMIEII